MAEFVNVTITRSIGGGRVYRENPDDPEKAVSKTLSTGRMYPMRKKDAKYWIAQRWAVEGDETEKYRDLARQRDETNKRLAEQKAASLLLESKRLADLATKGRTTERVVTVKTRGKKPR